MPKYVECVSDSDEEIVIVPFVKPTPPLIDVIDDEEEKNNTSSKKATKKSKKKAIKTDCPENSVNNNVPNAKPSVITGSSDDYPAEKTGRNEEQNLRSKNGAGPSKAAYANKSIPESVADSAQNCEIAPSHMATLSNSLFESVSNCDIMIPPMVPPEGDSDNPASRAKGRRRSLLPLSYSSATKKTAAEITSFLNSLGIPVVAKDFLTPVQTRVSRIKRKSLEVQLSEEILHSGTSLPSVSNIICSEPAPESQDTCVSGQLGAENRSEGFVQVTPEKNSPTKKKSKTSKKKPSEKTPPTKSSEVCIASNTKESTLQANLISNLVFPITVPQWHQIPVSNSSSSTVQMDEEATTECSRKRKRKNSSNLSDGQSSSTGTSMGNDNNSIVSSEKEDVGDSTKKPKEQSSGLDEDNRKETIQTKIKSKKTEKSSEMLESVNLDEGLTSYQQTEHKRRYEPWCSNCKGKGHNYYTCQRPGPKSNPPYHRNKHFIGQEEDVPQENNMLNIEDRDEDIRIIYLNTL